MISFKQIFKNDSNVENNNITRFVVQKHYADKAGIHYDLRIEKDGVLKSWVSKKLPDVYESEKIILFPTPDHDLNWLTFFGEIKDGYGKGRVEIWDSGKCKILKWDKNRIRIIFYGKKLKGSFLFIPYRENWLMIFINK